MTWHLAAFAALMLSGSGMALADTGSDIPTAAIPAVKCLYGLFKSSPAVQAADLYTIEKGRSAIEFRFKGKDGNIIVAYLMLLTVSTPVTYDVTIPRKEPETAGWESVDFISSLKLSSGCGVTAAFDNLVPGPKPRPEWQQVDWSTLSPSASPGPR